MQRWLHIPAAHTSPRATRSVSLAATATLIGILLTLPPALAMDASEEAPRHSLRPGVWALEVEVQPKLSGVYGVAGIAAKRHFTTRSALRLGFLVAVSHSDGGGERRVDRLTPYDTTLESTPLVNDSDRRDVTMFLHYVRLLSVGADAYESFDQSGTHWDRQLQTVHYDGFSIQSTPAVMTTEG